MGEILFYHVRVTKTWKISNYIWNYWLENWKKKTGCWSKFIVIRGFFIEMKYYTIQNIWKEIGKLNFMIIDVDLSRKGIAYNHDIIQHVDYLYLVCFVVNRWYLFKYAGFQWLMQV